ncbi:MAG: peptidylprolyl isomerase [Planctomycetota bacterium]
MKTLAILSLSLATLLVGCAGTKATPAENAACGIDACAPDPGRTPAKKADACATDACACGAETTEAAACGAGDADACGTGGIKADACGTGIKADACGAGGTKADAGGAETTKAAACGPGETAACGAGTEKTAAPKPTVLDHIDEFITVNVDKSGDEWRLSLPRPPQLPFDENKRYYWILDTTKGPIRIKLMPEVAPMHVSSTIYLTRAGFYDRIMFHRIIPGFMAQGGCPLGTGTGSPGYKYAGEYDKRVRHDTGGLLSMANAGPNTDGSQFFLTFKATPWPDDKHTIFGKVGDPQSFKTLRALEASGQGGGRPIETITIKKATIEIH